MNDNNKDAQATHQRLKELLYDLQQLESVNELIRANDFAGFNSLSRAQQNDVLHVTSDMAVDARLALETALRCQSDQKAN